MAGCLAVTLVLALVSCEREQRQFRIPPWAADRTKAGHAAALASGSAQPATLIPGPYAENAYAIAEGQRLYRWFNCAGCHFRGGGGIGPPLMDEQWIYGSAPANIFATIVEGRPNGMPSFRGRLPDYQIWQLVAYVRSLNGLVAKDAIPSRSDHMSAKKPEPSITIESPRVIVVPAPSEQTQ